MAKKQAEQKPAAQEQAIEFADVTGLNIHQRLARIAAEVPAILRKQADFGAGKAKFKYLAYDAIIEQVRPLFLKYQVMMTSTVVGHEFVPSNRTHLNVLIEYYCIDNPADVLSMTIHADGIDSSDKGAGKALTYARKMALIHTLMLRGSDDVENSGQEFRPKVSMARIENILKFLEGKGVPRERILQDYKFGDVEEFLDEPDYINELATKCKNIRDGILDVEMAFPSKIVDADGIPV